MSKVLWKKRRRYETTEGTEDSVFSRRISIKRCNREDEVIVELKAVEVMNRIYEAQLLTYLKATGKRVGLLINFNVERLKDGIKRLII